MDCHGIYKTYVIRKLQYIQFDKFDREKKPFEQHLLFIQSKAAIIPISTAIAINAAAIKLKVRTEKPKFGLADVIQLATAQEKEIIL